MSNDTTPHRRGARSAALRRFFAFTEPEGAGGDGRRKVEVRRGWFERHWAVVSVGTTTLLVLGPAGGWLSYLDASFNPAKVTLTVPDEDRPPENTGEDLNILLAGADNGPGQSIAEDMAAGTWSEGAHRSDEDGQSVVILDESQSEVLWRSVENDKVAKYLRRFGDDSGVLGDPGTVG